MLIAEATWHYVLVFCVAIPVFAFIFWLMWHERQLLIFYFPRKSMDKPSINFEHFYQCFDNLPDEVLVALFARSQGEVVKLKIENLATTNLPIAIYEFVEWLIKEKNDYLLATKVIYTYTAFPVDISCQIVDEIRDANS